MYIFYYKYCLLIFKGIILFIKNDLMMHFEEGPHNTLNIFEEGPHNTLNIFEEGPHNTLYVFLYFILIL